MNGNGYFWKGLADSFSGFRDFKFKEALSRPQSDPMELLRINAARNEGALDRQNRLDIANAQAGNRDRLDPSGVIRSHIDAAIDLETKAAALGSDYTAMTPQQRADHGRMMNEAVFHRKVANQMTSTNYGVRMPSVVDPAKRKTTAESLAEALSEFRKNKSQPAGGGLVQRKPVKP